MQRQAPEYEQSNPYNFRQRSIPGSQDNQAEVKTKSLDLNQEPREQSGSYKKRLTNSQAEV